MCVPYLLIHFSVSKRKDQLHCSSLPFSVVYVASNIKLTVSNDVGIVRKETLLTVLTHYPSESLKGKEITWKTSCKGEDKIKVDMKKSAEQCSIFG
jgi:hypothetical protein